MKNKQLLHELSLLVLSIFSYIFSAFYAPFLIWIAFVPLLYLIYRTNLKRTIVYSVLYGIITPAILFHWIRYYSLSTYFSSLILVSSFYYLFPIITKILIKKIRYPFNIAIPPIVWSALQSIYHLSIISSSWANIGAFQPMLAPIIWFVKGFGITFLIILFNSMTFFLIIKRNKKLLQGIFVFVIIILSSFLYSSFAQSNGDSLRVALIQANIHESFDWRQEYADTVVLAKYKNLTLTAAQHNPDIIVWSEYSLPVDLEEYPHLFNELSNLAQSAKAYLILGMLRWENEERINFKDTAVIFSFNGTFLGEYQSLKPIIFDSRVIGGQNLGIFDLGGKNVGLTICYEETQGDIAKKLSNEGADFFISLSNNQRFRESKGLYITSIHMRIHSTENKKYLVRGTNTGITQVVNPYGKVVASLKPNTEDILIADIFV